MRRCFVAEVVVGVVGNVVVFVADRPFAGRLSRITREPGRGGNMCSCIP